MNDALRRAIRTFLQAFVGTLSLLLIPFLSDIAKSAGEADKGIVEISTDALGNILIAAVVAGVIALISFVQNELEDKTNMPAILKAPASSGQNPAPDNANP
jgi:TRAP-type C4-dicarboxylate transport system permease small subunit